MVVLYLTTLQLKGPILTDGSFSFSDPEKFPLKNIQYSIAEKSGGRQADFYNGQYYADFPAKYPGKN